MKPFQSITRPLYQKHRLDGPVARCSFPNDPPAPISEPNFTVDTLWSLLENNNITNFDPVKEAFKVPAIWAVGAVFLSWSKVGHINHGG